MKLNKAIKSFKKLGDELNDYLANPTSHPDWEEAIALAHHQNTWFTHENIVYALQHIAPWLTEETLQKWLAKYPLPEENKEPLAVGVIMAGNIPMAGFHDLLCVLLTGNVLCAKLSHSDTVLMRFIAKKLVEIEPGWESQIRFVNKLSVSAGAVIATGSNNSAAHFEYYFRNVPRIIRKNRNGIAVLDGHESNSELSGLGEDIFTYFGLGCRNVSKLYLPEGYDFAGFFKNIKKFGDVINRHTYANNYTYNRTIYLMDAKVFTDNNFVLLVENKAIASPVSVIHYEYYRDMEKLGSCLQAERENIQCIAVNNAVKKDLQNLASLPIVSPGKTQSPSLEDYADGVDVIKFLLEHEHK